MFINNKIENRIIFGNEKSIINLYSNFHRRKFEYKMFNYLLDLEDNSSER